MKDVLKLGVDRRMMFINLENFWTGISIAFYSGMLVEMMSAAIAFNNTGPDALDAEALDSY